MIISHASHFIFFHNPKSAGTSIRSALGHYHDDPHIFKGIYQGAGLPCPLDFAHLRCWELKALFPELMARTADYRSVILVRNPYRRFLSAIVQHYKAYWPTIPLAAMEPLQQRNIVEDLVRMLSTDIRRVVLDLRYVHFSPQTWFILRDDSQLPGNVIAVDDAGAFHETVFRCLGLPPSPVRHENRSAVDLTHTLASPGVLSFVQASYQPDFAFLTADPALAHLASEP